MRKQQFSQKENDEISSMLDIMVHGLSHDDALKILKDFRGWKNNDKEANQIIDKKIREVEKAKHQSKFEITDQKELEKFFEKMVVGKDGEECLGAADPLLILLENGMHGELRALEKMDIRGGDLYSLWNDCSRRDMKKFLSSLWVLASGAYTENDIEANFAPLRSNATQGQIKRDNRAVALPFVYDNIKIEDFFKDLSQVKIDSPEFLRFARTNATRFRLNIMSRRLGREMSDGGKIIENGSGTFFQAKDKDGKTILMNVKQIEELFMGSKDKYFDKLKDKHDFDKVMQWLPHTAKHFLPSLSVIQKYPVSEVKNFFGNNNYKRLLELKKQYGIDDLEGMEGLTAISYVLGLFDTQGKTSEKATRYIQEHFIGKKVSDQDVHRIYGNIDLSLGFNKNFADFFMQHYAKDPKAFVNEQDGRNMAGTLFTNFDKVLQFRPEKKIITNTRSQLLTPKDAMSVFINSYDFSQLKNCLDMSLEQLKAHLIKSGASASDIERAVQTLELIKKADIKNGDAVDLHLFLSQYGASQREVVWALELFKRAQAINERDVKIPFVQDKLKKLITFETLKKVDSRAFISGKKTNSCSGFGGLAQDRLERAIADPLSRYVLFESPNKSYFDSLVWYDPEDELVVLDNIEGQFHGKDRQDESAEKELLDSVLRYSDAVFQGMKDMRLPCKRVNLGKGQPYRLRDIFESAERDRIILDDPKPSTYPQRHAISTDATQQYTLTNQEKYEERQAEASR